QVGEGRNHVASLGGDEGDVAAEKEVVDREKAQQVGEESGADAAQPGRDDERQVEEREALPVGDQQVESEADADRDPDARQRRQVAEHPPQRRALLHPSILVRARDSRSAGKRNERRRRYTEGMSADKWPGGISTGASVMDAA